MGFSFLFYFSIASADSYIVEKSDFYPALDIHEVSQVLYSHGFNEFDLSKRGQILSGAMDQIYFNINASDEIGILKLDLKLISNSKILQLSDREFVCHAQTSRGRSFSLYLKGRSQQDFSSICNSFANSKKSSRSATFLHFLIPEVMAANAGGCELGPTTAKNFREIRGRLSANLIVQKFGTCLTRFLQGSASTFTGVVSSIEALKDPVELWRKISVEAIAMKNFVLHMQSEITDAIEATANLDGELILHAYCHLLGEMGTSIGITALTGVGLVKLGAQFTQGLMKMVRTKSLFSRLNDLKRAGQIKAAKEILSCGT